MAELKNIRIAISGLYDYAFEELPSLRLALPGQGAPEYVEKKNIYKVYRPANVLAAACDKFKLLPLTHHHPQAPVDGQNFRDLAIGYTGENPWVDYLKDKDEVGIRSNVLLYDDEAFDAYERGERQLSPGYMANFEWVQGGKTPKGEPYDIVMTAITDVNHLALLPAGRGGEDAVVMDKAITIFDIVRNHEVSDAKDFNESDVNRDKDGKFASKGESSSNSETHKKEDKDDDETAEARKIPYAKRTALRKVLTDKLKDNVKKGYIENNTIGKTAISNHSVGKLGSDKALSKSLLNGFSAEEHFDAAGRIVDLFKDAPLISSKPDKYGDVNVLSMKRFNKHFKTSEGRDASAWITVKESKAIGNRLYTIEVMEIKKADERSAQESGAGNNQLHAATNTIAQDAEKIKQTNCYMTIFDRVKGTVFDLYK